MSECVCVCVYVCVWTHMHVDSEIYKTWPLPPTSFLTIPYKFQEGK